jgi:hypothetical protein
MIRSRWHAILLSGLFLGALSGNWNDTSTGIDLRKLHQFPLTKIRSGALKPGSRIAFDSITAAAIANAHEVRLRGKGKSGQPWEVRLADLDEVWRGDLDGNGAQDYIFFSTGPYGNGRLAPPFSLSILLMDSEGMPTPFFTTLYHGENGDGIRHLVDLQRDGHAELLDSVYDEDPSDPYVGPFCSGHWVNRLYRFKDAGIEEIPGVFGGMTFPLVHNWSYRGTECPKLEKPFGPVRSARLFQRFAHKLNTTIRKVDSTGYLGIQPVSGCSVINPGTIVYDQPQLREIAFPNPFSEYPTALANRIRRAGATVELRDVNKLMTQGECGVDTIWAH